ncbi:MAG TPA: hypothetical protein VGF28_21595 [Thermoanaerobaculia bacterium]|jgi:hypothetical protein
MSVLAFPRLYFQGYLSWDPNVTNNSSRVWDPVNVNVKLPAGVTPATYQQYILDHASSLGDWNVYGSHACDFVQYQGFTSRITGGSLGSGTITSDAVVGQPLSMPGRLVDLDPRAVDTSQYFFDRFSIGSLVSGPCAQRMHSRWINFSRNLNVAQDPRVQIAGVAGVVWQTTLPAATLQLEAAGSPLLEAFARGLGQSNVQGLMVRFATYRTLYFQNGIFNDIAETPRSMAELQALYAQGKMFSNPTYSVVTGAVGLWLDHEVPSVPVGRYLVPDGGSQNPNGLGPVVAEYNASAGVLSLDFGSAIPETGYDLEKLSFGDLTISADGTEIATLTPDQYGREAYQATGGIIDVPVAGAGAVAGLLTISGTLNGSPVAMYAESDLAAQTDTKNMYLDEGESMQVSVYVTERGQPALEGTLVQVAQYPASQSNPVVMATPLRVGANGLATFTITASGPGYSYYRFTPYSASTIPPAPPMSIDTTVDFYCGVRTLPFDDELNASTPDSVLTWDWVYTNILQPFNLCPAAAMLAIGIPLSSQQIWETPAMAARIKALTAAANFPNTSYMPITRELSNGMRNLLARWADLVIAGTQPTALAGAAPAVAVSPPRRTLVREAN